MDILLGNYLVGCGEGTLTPSPLDQKSMRPENLVMVALLLVGAAMLTIALFLPTVHVAHHMTQVHVAHTLSNGTGGTPQVCILTPRSESKSNGGGGCTRASAGAHVQVQGLDARAGYRCMEEVD
jgi:hypothetical protein